MPRSWLLKRQAQEREEEDGLNDEKQGCYGVPERERGLEQAVPKGGLAACTVGSCAVVPVR